MCRVCNISKNDESIVLLERVQTKILYIRGRKVILDADLAALYDVPTKRLNERVKRNRKRFPTDFMFQLTKDEKEELVANCDHLHRLKFSSVLPSAFTEYGAIMAASLLNSEQAIRRSIYVVRAFVRLRQMLAPYRDFLGRLDQFEKKLQVHDRQIISIIQVIKLLVPPPVEKPKEPFGFHRKL
jgi:hypothetical protein